MRGKETKQHCNSNGVELYTAKNLIDEIHLLVLKSKKPFRFNTIRY